MSSGEYGIGGLVGTTATATATANHSVNGMDLSSALSSLGFNDGDDGRSITTDALDWMFSASDSSPNIHSFLQWIIEGLTPKNVVSVEDMASFNKLDNVMDGTTLYHALNVLEDHGGYKAGDDKKSDVSMKEDIDVLESRLAAERQDVVRLAERRDQMSIMHAALTRREARLDTAVTQMDTTTGHQRIELSRVMNDSVNSSLDGVMNASSDYVEAINGSGIAGVSFDGYMAAEADFRRQLTTFCKKQFHEGIGPQLRQQESERYTWLNINDNDDGLYDDASVGYCGEDVSSEIAYRNSNRELLRLQGIYEVSEMENIDARQTLMAMNAEHSSLARQMDSLHTITNGANSLSTWTQRASETQHLMESVQREEANVMSDIVEPLLADLRDSIANGVLRGDYNLKLARQDALTAKQDRVIDQLARQGSRLEFLRTCLMYEERAIQKTSKDIATAAEDANVAHKRRLARIAHMNSMTGHVCSRQTVDTGDELLRRVAELLALPIISAGRPKYEKHSERNEDEDSSNGLGSKFVTFDGLVGRASILRDQSASLHHLLSEEIGEANVALSELQMLAQRLRSACFKDSTTSTEASLTAASLAKCLHVLEQHCTEFTEGLQGVLLDQESRRKNLHIDPLARQARELFVYFFAHPERLRRTVAALREKVEAQNIAY